MHIADIIFACLSCATSTRPFRAGPFWGAFLGLKPQAESYHPFGVET
jgi:hypothetical protein